MLSRLPRPSPRLLVGIALALIGVGALVVSGAYGGEPEAEVLGANLPVNDGARQPTDLSSHNSPTIAQSPIEPKTLAIANRIDTPRYSCALHVSFNGGRSWRQQPVPAPPKAADAGLCYAPDVAFGADGRLYMTFVTLQGNGNVPAAAWIVSSRDGRKLSTPNKVLGPRAFQVRLAADPEEPERLYLTWLQGKEVGLYRLSQPSNPIRFISSENGGKAWTEPVKISGSHDRAVGAAPVVGPDDELYALFLDLGDDDLDYGGAHEGKGGPPYDGSWQLALARSTDGGESWSDSVVDDGLVPTERFIVFIPPFPSLAVDPSGGRLYAGFQDGALGDADIAVWSSGDGGENWGDPVRVNDTPEEDGTTQTRPKLAVAPNGRLDVAYYDRRADPKDVKTTVSLQSSFDEGESFDSRVRLSDRSFSSKIGFGSDRELPDLGSRLGLIAADSRSLAAWSDTRAGTPASGKQDLSSAVVGFDEPDELPGWAKLLLRVGGALAILAGLLLGLDAGRRRPAQRSPERKDKAASTPEGEAGPV